MRRANPDGNERLTAAVGVLLLVSILVELATIVLGVHSFMSLHLFVGLALIPPVLLKLASTGWRFGRYCTRSRAYVDYGPPRLAMRLLAPLLVVATIVLFSSGVGRPPPLPETFRSTRLVLRLAADGSGLGLDLSRPIS